ncbi:carboxypeptidase regulatory-like domain-containing protein [Sphingomonas sp. KR1UV-12]|uniref:Carboxypeptidase regulatory-like domain-containing protein n=1 Tax=Sphingomonas aurea TaxID=3063994 RepID=A0ABT9EIF6_9SPHN|nr:carboxypeptidase regulatory-like domain-containing protein [Sphingomonas sp. KR1UV-12]MDP1026741.1 carboxypeptidase regulatory-like domain-containing protein [Sphingomonas sp. KR1UV-12]
MRPEALLAVLLVAAVVLGWVRLGWWQWRAPTRSRARRIAALAGLQPVLAGLLWLTLLPPRIAGDAGVLVVATAGAPRLVATGPAERLVALPEAQVTGAERAPDLATALRRYPGTSGLRVVGGGLAARDREAVRGLALAFDPPALPRGLVRLYPPAAVAPGAAFQVAAQIAGVAGGSVELLDPAGRLVDRVAPGADGVAVLGGTARAAGAALFTIRVRGADQAAVEEAAVPVLAVAPLPTRVAIVAGAPGPEVKFLRRWATDAGLAPLVRARLGGGAVVGDGPALTAPALARIDLAIFDDRGWASLSPGERAAVAGAVRSGMGALLRVTGPLPAGVRAQWRAMGIDVAGGQATAPVALAPAAPSEQALQARRGPEPAAAPRDDLPELTRRVVTLPGAVPVLRDAKGAVLAGWRPSGRGRVGVWLVEDSFGLVSAGHGDRYGEWWGGVAAALARPDTRPVVRVESLPRAGERTAVCDLPPGPATVAAPDGRRVALVSDPAAGGCAGYWPQAAGWHLLTGGQGLVRPLYVQPADALPGVRATARRDATLALVGGGNARRDAPESARGASWPWFLGWLAAAGCAWWLERRRSGRPKEA